VDRASRTVFVSADNVEIDLGGVGKGYAVDRVADVLRDWNIDSALVNAGQSTLLALGCAPDGQPWRIAIRDPRDHARSLGAVRLADRALSGSGVALHGQHIIDPRSGAPARGGLGAWALAPDAALSDALSTAFMILSDDEIEAYCADHNAVGAIMFPEGVEGVPRTFGTVVLEPVNSDQ
jgi:thiamine biosynthesis lipoprotein